MAMRILALHCPYWPLLSAGISPGTPAAVVEANRVKVASPGAEALGISTGLRRREAEMRCPALAILSPDPGVEARAFEKVLAALESFTPAIEILQPGSCLFATAACVRYFGSEENLANLVSTTISAKVGQPGCFGLGVADTLFSAFVAAHQSLGTGHPVVAPPGEARRFLAPLSVSSLNRPELSDLLVRLGIRTLGQFADLPAADVLARFGNDGLRAHRQAEGLDEHVFRPRPHQPALELVEELDPPAQQADVAVFAGKGLADELALRLDAEGLACNKLIIEAVTKDGQTLSRTWRLDGGFSSGAILQRVRWQLEGWLSRAEEGTPTGGLTKLTLIPEEVVAGRGVQLSFWGGQTEPGHRAVRGIARIQGLMGPESVVVPELKGGRSPDDRFRVVPADGVDLLNRSATPPFLPNAPWPGALPAPSPALVFAGRKVVTLLDGSGEKLEIVDGHLGAELHWIRIGPG
ncbi:MAG: DNA polymerase Y family protein, partial [Actinomycetota bacterium]|nr:DNA polymerase Y family protein [Actinomycetota bacterium]